jgi:7,8-dihydroneopterin aldolase/epimerase/oxygenase
MAAIADTRMFCMGFCYSRFFRYGAAMIKKQASESHIAVFADEISVDARIGLHPSENKPQRLRVSVKLYAAPSYLNGVSEDSIIDYKIVRDAVLAWEGREHVRLVETYVRELLDLAFSLKSVEAARVSVAKANIFPESKGAGVEAFMTRGDYNKKITA